MNYINKKKCFKLPLTLSNLYRGSLEKAGRFCSAFFLPMLFDRK